MKIVIPTEVWEEWVAGWTWQTGSISSITCNELECFIVKISAFVPLFGSEFLCSTLTRKMERTNQRSKILAQQKENNKSYLQSQEWFMAVRDGDVLFRWVFRFPWEAKIIHKMPSLKTKRWIYCLSKTSIGVVVVLSNTAVIPLWLLYARTLRALKANQNFLFYRNFSKMLFHAVIQNAPQSSWSHSFLFFSFVFLWRQFFSSFGYVQRGINYTIRQIWARWWRQHNSKSD